MDRRVAFAGYLVIAGACAPFGSAADGATDGGGADGGAPVTDDGGGADASEARAPDAGASPCKAGHAHAVCEDFDGPFPWQGWTSKEASGSPIERGTTRFVSPPASLHVTVQPNASVADHLSFLHRQLPPAQHVVVTADLAVTPSTSPTPDGEIDVISLELNQPTGFDRYFVAIVAKSEGMYVLEADVRPTGAIPPGGTPLAIGNLGPEFKRLVLDLDLDEGKVMASFDGATPTSLALVSTMSLGARLQVGAAWANNTTGTFSVDVDDVIVDQ